MTNNKQIIVAFAEAFMAVAFSGSCRTVIGPNFECSWKSRTRGHNCHKSRWVRSEVRSSCRADGWSIGQCSATVIDWQMLSCCHLGKFCLGRQDGRHELVDFVLFRCSHLAERRSWFAEIQSGATGAPLARIGVYQLARIDHYK